MKREMYSGATAQSNKVITDSRGKSALVVAHPGHELCVYHWLETSHPLVFVLTDGSGRTGTPRLDSTTKILSAAGCRSGSVYGRFTDPAIYAAILGGDFAPFERLVADLAEALLSEEIEYVAGDAAEGYNPSHDVCRLVIDAAVELATYLKGRPIVNRDFLLFGRHDTHPEKLRTSALWLELDDDSLARKLAVARAYPELKGEVDAALGKKMLDSLQSFPELSAQARAVSNAMGSEAYRVECLRLVVCGASTNPIKEVPFYERYGELLVASGVYQSAIRYHDHIAPIAEALQTFVESQTFARLPLDARLEA